MSQGFVKGTASVNTNEVTVTLDNNVDASHVSSGTAVFIGGYPPVEAIGGTIGQITLREPWTYPNQVSAAFTSIYTIEGLVNAITNAEQLGEEYLSLLSGQRELLTSTDPTITLDVAGVPTEFTPYQYLSNQVASLLGAAQQVEEDMTAVEGRLTVVENDLTAIEGTLDQKVTDAQQAVTDAQAQVVLAEDEVQKAKDWATSAAQPEAGLESSKTYAELSGQEKDLAQAASDISLANANYKGEWSTNPDGTPRTGAANVPFAVSEGSGVYMLINNIADITASQPSLNPSDWKQVASIGGTATDSQRLGGELPSYYATEQALANLTQALSDLSDTVALKSEMITYQDPANTTFNVGRDLNVVNVRTGGRSHTIGNASYSIDDSFEINMQKLNLATTTFTLSAGTINFPDGSTASSLELEPEQFTFTAILTKRTSTTWDLQMRL